MEWVKEHNAAPYPETVIAWLACNGLIREEETVNFLHQRIEQEQIQFEDARTSQIQKETEPEDLAEVVKLSAQQIRMDAAAPARDDFCKRFMEWAARQATKPEAMIRVYDPFRNEHGDWIYGAMLGGDLTIPKDDYFAASYMGQFDTYQNNCPEIPVSLNDKEETKK